MIHFIKRRSSPSITRLQSPRSLVKPVNRVTGHFVIVGGTRHVFMSDHCITTRRPQKYEKVLHNTEHEKVIIDD